MSIKHRDYRFWCDDMRTPKSNDWTICRSVESFLTKIKRIPIEVLREKFTLALDDYSGVTKNGSRKPKFHLILDWCIVNKVYPKDIYLLSPNHTLEKEVLFFVKLLNSVNIYSDVHSAYKLPFYFNPITEQTNKTFVDDFTKAKKVENEYKHFIKCSFRNNDTQFSLRKILSVTDCVSNIDETIYYYKILENGFYKYYDRISVYINIENEFNLRSHLRELKYNIFAITESQYNELHDLLTQTEVSKEDITETLKEYFSNLKN